MIKKLLFAFSAVIFAISPLVAQTIQSAHQLNQSCYVGTNGKITVNAGGHYTTAASEQVFLRDSIYSSTFDTVNSVFRNNKKMYFTYDNGGLLQESSSKSLDKNGTTWSNSQLIGYKYTGFQLFEETWQAWDKTLTNWVNFIQYKYSYESDNSLSSIFNLPWNADSSEWNYSTKDLISYDLNKNVTSIANQKWNKNLSSWENYLRINFTYAAGNVAEILYQAWNKSTQTWDDYQKETFVYSNNSKSEVVMQVKSGTTDWENYSRNVFVYENANLSTCTEYLWYGSWTGNRKFSYTYNASNLETSKVTQQWAANLSSFRNQLQDESYYTQHEIFGITENPTGILLVKNPLAKHEAFQLINLKTNKVYHMKLISLAGVTVTSLQVTAGQTIVFGNQLPNGIYILQITEPGLEPVNQKVLITD